MTPSEPVFVLGGAQTDFKRNVTREGGALIDLLREVAQGALADADVEVSDVGAAHIGNFAAERFCDQGHLGGLLIEAMPELAGIPTGRHEAACASGSVAAMAAMAEIEAGRCDVALLVGVELMRNVGGREASVHLAPAAWAPEETEGVPWLWPQVFSDVGDAYERRYGLDRKHLAAISEQAFANAKRNPFAQTRTWELSPESFAEDDEHNPVIAGRIRRHDCSQITDGAAAVVLASKRFAETWASMTDRKLDQVARVLGWGQRTARMSFRGKLDDAKSEPYVFPGVRGTIEDAFSRAGLSGVSDIDVIETHDCFTTTWYMAVDHFGITAPGESWRAIEEGDVFFAGKIPINPSGGLIGLGHPVGATGVRMLLDATRQVTGRAGETQVEGAHRAATLNIGGSATTAASFVVGTKGRS